MSYYDIGACYYLEVNKILLFGGKDFEQKN